MSPQYYLGFYKRGRVYLEGGEHALALLDAGSALQLEDCIIVRRLMAEAKEGGGDGVGAEKERNVITARETARAKRREKAKVREEQTRYCQGLDEQLSEQSYLQRSNFARALKAHRERHAQSKLRTDPSYARVPIHPDTLHSAPPQNTTGDTVPLMSVR